MKKSIATLGVVAACAACCAPVVAPLLFGAGWLGASVAGSTLLLGLSSDVVACSAIALALMFSVGFVIRAWPRRLEEQAACACETSCITNTCDTASD